jgi:hypothetical protein
MTIGRCTVTVPGLDCSPDAGASLKLEELILEMLLTNGRFFDLAYRNESHFAPDNGIIGIGGRGKLKRFETN